MPSITNPFIACPVIAMGSISLGLTLAYYSPTQAQIRPLFGLSSIESNLFNVCSLLTAIPSAIIMHFVVQKVGRRVSSFISGVVALITWIILGLADSKVVLFVFRCLNGATVGFFSTVCPVFISELSPPHLTGAFGYVNQLGLAVGFMLPTIFGMFADWRGVTYLCGIPAAILSLFSLFIPNPVGTDVPGSFFSVFSFPKELLQSFFLMFFLQFSGINALVANMEKIITNANLDVSVQAIALVANVSQIIATGLAAILVDKLGRKYCWVMSSIGQLVAFLLLTCQQLFELHGSLFIVGLFAEQLFYGVGTGPIPFLLTAELFRVDVRSSAMGLMTGCNWALSSIVTFIWPLMEEGLGLGYSFLFFGAVSVFSTVFGVYFVSQSAKNDEESTSSSSSGNDMTRKLSSSKKIAEI